MLLPPDLGPSLRLLVTERKMIACLLVTERKMIACLLVTERKMIACLLVTERKMIACLLFAICTHIILARHARARACVRVCDSFTVSVVSGD